MSSKNKRRAPAVDTPPAVDVPVRKSLVFTVVHELNHDNKKYLPGSTVDLQGLKQEKIDRLIERGIVK